MHVDYCRMAFQISKSLIYYYVTLHNQAKNLLYFIARIKISKKQKKQSNKVSDFNEFFFAKNKTSK